MLKSTLLIGICAVVVSCSPKNEKAGEIKLNQVGYYPTQEKIAIWEGEPVNTFTVLNASTKQSVLTGNADQTNQSAWSDKKRTRLDFSSLTESGDYILQVGESSAPFAIRHEALRPLAQAAFKAFYFQRTGMPIEQPYSGQWSRPAGHNDTQVLIHASAATAERPEGTVISSPLGWYDAGDYNKYVVNSAFSIGLMLSMYEAMPEYFNQLSLDIPEKGNGTPDVLDEMMYNLKWLLTMQDTDGGVYHKLTTPSFEDFIKPTDCQKTRYVVQKSVTGTLDFAAVMVQSARILSKYGKDYADFAEKANVAAVRAWQWAVAHPEALYDQDKNNQNFKPEISTGTYGDSHAEDEFFWAAAELNRLYPDNKEYAEAMRKYVPKQYFQPTWGNVSALGFFTQLNNGQSSDTLFRNSLQKEFLAYCDTLVAADHNSCFCAAYGNRPEDFYWGCLSEGCGNQAISLLLGYCQTQREEYRKEALRNMDYLLGRNATGYCYVTGFGTKSPMHPHHRLSASDNIEAPLPGFLVGGPNPGRQDRASVSYPSESPDECYLDMEASYASNEIAINWNATLSALAAGLDATFQK